MQGIEGVRARLAEIEASFAAVRPPPTVAAPPTRDFAAVLAGAAPSTGPRTGEQSAPVTGPDLGREARPTAVGTPAAGPFADLFAAAGARHGVSARLLTAVARAESGFNPRAVSRAGAQGLMQLMPGTARSLGVADPFDPAQAVDGAARLLAGHLRRYGGDVSRALAAYNAGPGAVARYGGVPPYPETQGYVRRILEELGGQL